MINFVSGKIIDVKKNRQCHKDTAWEKRDLTTEKN